MSADEFVFALEPEILIGAARLQDGDLRLAQKIIAIDGGIEVALQGGDLLARDEVGSAKQGKTNDTNRSDETDLKFDAYFGEKPTRKTLPNTTMQIAPRLDLYISVNSIGAEIR